MSNQDQVFKQHPSLKSYHKTSDGTAFYKKEHAQAHARGLKDKKVTEVVNPDPKAAPAPVEKTEQKSATSSQQLDDLTPMQKAKNRALAISNLETVDEVKESLKGETAKTVIEAGQERIEALEAKAKGGETPTDEEE